MTASTDHTPAAALWNAIADELQQTLAAPTYSAWFGRASGKALTAEELEVEVPNEFVRSWISGHFMDLVTSAATNAHGAPLAVALTVGADAVDVAVASEAAPEAPIADVSVAPTPAVTALPLAVEPVPPLPFA